MRKDIEQWIKDLRSGKYKQGRHGFKQKCGGGYSYSCLGVYAERQLDVNLIGLKPDDSDGVFNTLRDLLDNTVKHKGLIWDLMTRNHLMKLLIT